MPRLKREITLGTAIILVIANMIGTGIFTTSGFLMASLQNTHAMLICWVIGGVIALCGALCYGELGAMFPMAGGEYVFLKKSFGKLPAFLSGWVSLIVGFSAPIAAASIAFAAYFFRTLPDTVIPSPHTSLISNRLINLSPVTFLAVLIIIVFSLIHWSSLRFGSRIQNILTLFKILVIVVFIAAGLFFGNGSLSHFSGGLKGQILFSTDFATSLIYVSFAYSGWNAAAYLGGEIKNPQKNIPLATIWGTLIVLILYLLLNMVFVYALGTEEMKGVVEIGAKSAHHLFGPATGTIFSAAMTVCLLSVISAMIMAGPRVYYAMSGDGIFFKQVGVVSKKHHTPGFSIYMQAILAIVMVITASFDKLLIYMGFTLSIFTMLTVCGMMLLRTRIPTEIRPYRTFGYPLTPLIFIFMNLWIVIFSIKGNPTAVLCGGGTILAGVIAYYFFQFRN